MSENENREFKWGGWTMPYAYLLAEVTEMHDEMSHSPVQGLIAHIEKRLVEFETAVKNPTPKDTVRSMDIRVTKLDRMIGTLRDLKAEGARSKAYDFAKRLTQANIRRSIRYGNPQGRAESVDVAEARYGYGSKATDIVGYTWDADAHTPEETRKALKAGVLKATDPKARMDQHKIPDGGVEDREGNEIHPVFASDPEAKEFDESVEVTEDLGDSTMGGVNFYKQRTEPYQGLPDETIIGCYRGDKKIAEIWQEREDPKNPKKVTGYTVYPPTKGPSLKSFGTMPLDKPRYPSLNAAFAAARKFVVGVKTEEVEFTENAAPAAVGQATLKQGDILVCKWGATMRLVDFYKVVSVSGDWVILAQLGDKKVTGDGFIGTTVATSTVVGSNFRKKMKRGKDYSGNEHISVIINSSSRQYGQLWDGRPVSYDHLD